ncbi:VapE domain-containing protein [Paraburkholderia dipogonis]|uniref:VapE domain-containing protein n=1 Tax=Paraburkholderia dipogonis TaxID=1211383 RepID=UPI0038BD32A6
MRQRLRADIHAAKTADGPKCRRKPLTDAALLAHFHGGEPVGLYPMAEGSETTRVAVLDFDSHGGATPWVAMFDTAQRVALTAASRGLVAHGFRSSGGRGVHLIFVWDTPQHAYSVRQLMFEVLESNDLKNGASGGIAAGFVEVFPKNDFCADCGNMFVLPLGGKSLPLDLDDLDTEPMPREWALRRDWVASAPVPVLERPAPRPVSVDGLTMDLARVKAYCDLIPNSGDDELTYEDGPEGRSYFELMTAVHRATDGSDEGLAIAADMFGRAAIFKMDNLEYKWASITPREGGISVRTLIAAARHYAPEAVAALELVEIENDFDKLPAEPNPRPVYQRDSNGKVLALVGNVVKALRFPFECGAHIARDEFRAQNMIDGRVATDEDITELQMRLEARDFLKLGKDLVRDAFYKVAFENQYDSAIEWIGALRWDGVPRTERFLMDRFGADDTPYTRAVSRYMWTALAGRALSPGIQADMVPTLVGPQGIGKTQGVKAIAPAPELFCELGFAERDVEASRKMRGRLVIELGELRGMSARDVEGVKAFITRQTELFRDLYRNNMVEFHRRHLFIGTTNKDQFLSDDTGERRWLPVRVTKCDPSAIERDRDQLWAEAAVAFQQHGIAWRDAQRLAAAEHDEFKLQDEWEPTVLAWMHEDEGFGSGMPSARDFLRTDEVLIGALRFEAKTIRPGDSMRIAAILKKYGYERAQIRINGRKAWVYGRSQGGDLT